MKKSQRIAAVASFTRARSKEVVWFVGGVAVAAAVSATAQYAAAPPSQADCALNQAAQMAVNNRIQTIGMTSPDPGKYFNAGSPDSCLGNLSIANLDLSKLIPDPLGLLSIGIDEVLNGLKKAALAAGCMAVRNSVGDTIYKYNAAIGQVNGLTDVRGMTNQFIDTGIANASRQALDGYAMNWRTPTAVNVTGNTTTVPGVRLPSGGMPSGPTTLLNNNAAAAPSYTTAAANQESARLNLAAAQSRYDAVKVGFDDGQIEAAKAQVDQAYQQYRQAEAQTEAARVSTIGGGATVPSTSPASLGSRVFQ